MLEMATLQPVLCLTAVPKPPNPPGPFGRQPLLTREGRLPPPPPRCARKLQDEAVQARWVVTHQGSSVLVREAVRAAWSSLSSQAVPCVCGSHPGNTAALPRPGSRQQTGPGWGGVEGARGGAGGEPQVAEGLSIMWTASQAGEGGGLLSASLCLV